MSYFKNDRMILLFSPYSFAPLHPRIEFIDRALKNNGYDVVRYNLKCKKKLCHTLDWAFLLFYSVGAIFKSIYYINKHKSSIEYVYVQDLKYLPISIVGKLYGCKVIYETLDNNVELNIYRLKKRFNKEEGFSIIRSAGVNAEHYMAKHFCDKVIVNSKALSKYFNEIDTTLIYYSSPLEECFAKENGVGDNQSPDYSRIKNRVFIYLGYFSLDKGAAEILNFIEREGYELYIYGNVSDEGLGVKINRMRSVFVYQHVGSKELCGYLMKLSMKYRLIGFSMIKDVHYSYKTQEANKDIDYLAMGVPIVGNHREPTEEKIKSNCGVFIEDSKGILDLVNDDEFYDVMSNSCLDYYSRRYSLDRYDAKLMGVIE
jgi:glycosyltransferase involved in cell wall biosynthesis